MTLLKCPGGSDGKVSAHNAGDLGSISGWEDLLEKEMAIHSSTLAWKILWMEECNRLQSTGSQRVRHNWVTSLQSATLHMTANLENSAIATRLEKVSFHSNPKEGQCQRMFKLPHNCIHFTCSKSFKLGFNSTWTKNFQMYKLNLEKAENQRSNCQHPLYHRKTKIPHAKCWAGWSTSWNQDCREKYQ